MRGPPDDERRADGDAGWPEVPPGLAAILSFAVPGLGHMLLRLWSRAATWFAGWLLIAAITQTSHSGPMLALMLIAAIDAYLTGRERHPTEAPREGRTG